MAAPRAILGGAPQAGGAAGGLLRLLGGWFWEVEAAAAWGERLRRRRLRSRNQFCGFLRARHGEEVAAAIFTLSLGGGVRFEGQDQWLRPQGRWRHEVLRHRDVPVVALDLSGCPITYQGLANLAGLRGLRSLNLSGCPHVDDWALGRLHFLGATLRDLSVAHCPLVTERGLAALHHLRGLRRLEATGLRVPNAGLVGILLEETLPHCRVLGLGGGHQQDVETPPPAPGTPPAP